MFHLKLSSIPFPHVVSLIVYEKQKRASRKKGGFAGPGAGAGGFPFGRGVSYIQSFYLFLSLSGFFSLFSGLSIAFDPSTPSSVKTNAQGNFSSVDGEYRVKDVKVGGEALDLNKVYTVACHSYWLTS